MWLKETWVLCYRAAMSAAYNQKGQQHAALQTNVLCANALRIGLSNFGKGSRLRATSKVATQSVTIAC